MALIKPVPTDFGEKFLRAIGTLVLFKKTLKVKEQK